MPNPQSDSPDIVPSPTAIQALARLLRAVPTDTVPVTISPGSGITQNLVVVQRPPDDVK